MRSHLSAALVWGNLVKKGLRIQLASKLELRKSMLEEKNLCPRPSSEKKKLGAQNTSSYSQILWD